MSSYPKKLGSLNVTRIIDHTVGYDSANAPTYKSSLPASSGHMIQFYLETQDKYYMLTLTLR